MKKGNLFIASIFFTTILFSACGRKETKIGMQTWATKNLDVSSFRNGDAIPEAKTREDWIKAGEEGKPAWCYYEYDPTNGQKYGKLYNWYAVNDPKGLAPNGWHVSSSLEWVAMNNYLKGDATRA